MGNNPFILTPLTGKEPETFCDREEELKELTGYADNKVSVVLFSKRRFGKTSLTRMVQRSVVENGGIPIYCDLYGVLSVEEIAKRLAKTVYAVTHRHEPLFKRAMKAFAALRPVLKPDPEAGMKVSVDVAKGAQGLELLEQTMEGLRDFVDGLDRPVHIALDEFQEIVEVETGVSVQSAMRRSIQETSCSFFFVGSRRRILLDMFSDSGRPFYKSGFLFELKPLPREATIAYVMARFRQGGKTIAEGLAEDIWNRVQGHPYYLQRWCYLIHETAGDNVRREDLSRAMLLLLEREKPTSETILQGLAKSQRALLVALAKEPTSSPYSSKWMARHDLGSIGGVQGAKTVLENLDLIEQDGETWQLSDPILAAWIQGLFE
jgi:uncharacterized protein